MSYAGFSLTGNWMAPHDVGPARCISLSLRHSGGAQTKAILPFLAACLLCASVSSGDIAPMRYEGYTLSTKENSDIRMQNEEVNIYVAQRCRVNAKFEMQNETDKSIVLFVGFPVENEGAQKQTIYDFRVRINEKNAPRKVSARGRRTSMGRG